MHAGNFETCNTSHQYKISMEIVGALPEPEEILPNTISLFGILCKNVTESAECHFCLEQLKIKNHGPSQHLAATKKSTAAVLNVGR